MGLYADPLPALLSQTRQRSLRGPIGCVGVGLHSGRNVRLRMVPAPVDHGIVFRRTDLGVNIPARFDRVTDTRLCTLVSAEADPTIRVGTIEHLMAALAAAGISNLLVEVDGPELPALDGSAEPYLFLIDCAGVVEQDKARPVIEVLRHVRVEDGEAFAELRPNTADAFDLALSIVFDAAVIGRQSLSLRLTEDSFRRELASARTFAMRHEIAALQQAGLARGGSLDNAVVVDDATVLNPVGLRHPDEFVRHKLLDAVGDLSLGGALRARFVAHRSGHALNNKLLRAVFADQANWRQAMAPEWAPLSQAA